MSGNRLPQSYDIDNNILPTNDSDKVEPAYTDTNVIRHYFHLPTKLGLCRFYSLYIQKSLGICTQHWQNYGNLIKQGRSHHLKSGQVGVYLIFSNIRYYLNFLILL